MARPKTWRERIEAGLEGLKDRVREGLSALDDLLAPAPEPVPVPVSSGDGRRRRR